MSTGVRAQLHCRKLIIAISSYQSAYLIAFLNLIRKRIFVKLNLLMQSQIFQSPLSRSCFHNNSFWIHQLYHQVSDVEEVCLRMRRIFTLTGMLWNDFQFSISQHRMLLSLTSFECYYSCMHFVCSCFVHVSSICWASDLLSHPFSPSKDVDDNDLLASLPASTANILINYIKLSIYT